MGSSTNTPLIDAYRKYISDMGRPFCDNTCQSLKQDVQEIIAARPLTRIFRGPDAVAGVTSLRGEILPVLDVAALLGLARAAGDTPAGLAGDVRIVVVRESEGLRRRAGLRVDALGPVRALPNGLEGLDPPPPTLPARIRGLLHGVLREAPVCAVLDVRLLLDTPELLPLAGRAPAAGH